MSQEGNKTIFRGTISISQRVKQNIISRDSFLQENKSRDNYKEKSVRVAKLSKIMPTKSSNNVRSLEYSESIVL